MPDELESSVRRYLLGELRDEEAAAIEDRLFGEPSFAGQLEDEERDLLDDYAAGRLDRGRKAAVEERLAGSSAQRDRLRFAIALDTRRRRIAGRRRLWLAAAAVFVCAAALGAFYFPRTQPFAGNPGLRTPPAVAPSVAPRNPAVIASFLLQPGALRGAETAVLRIPAHAASVRLELQLDRESSGLVDATVRTAGGRTVWTQSGIRPYSAGTISAALIEVPAEKLIPGRYEVRLSGSDDFYYFRAIRLK